MTLSSLFFVTLAGFVVFAPAKAIAWKPKPALRTVLPADLGNLKPGARIRVIERSGRHDTGVFLGVNEANRVVIRNRMRSSAAEHKMVPAITSIPMVTVKSVDVLRDPRPTRALPALDTVPWHQIRRIKLGTRLRLRMPGLPAEHVTGKYVGMVKDTAAVILEVVRRTTAAERKADPSAKRFRKERRVIELHSGYEFDVLGKSNWEQPLPIW